MEGGGDLERRGQKRTGGVGGGKGKGGTEERGQVVARKEQKKNRS